MSDKKYNFDSFDQAVKQYDFSSFDAAIGDKQPVKASSEDPSMLESLARGVGEGATFGFSDELLAAAQSAGDVVTNKDKKLSDFVELYRQHKIEQESRNKQAAEANPWTSDIGNLAGGLIFPGVGSVGAATKGVGGVLKVGAAAGALAGLGTSEADLTKGELGQALKDTAIGAGVGAVTGGLVHGGVAAGKGALRFIRESEPIDNLINALKLGRREVDITSKKGTQELETRSTESAQNFIGDLKKSHTAAGVEVGKAKQATIDSGMEFDVSEANKLIRDRADELSLSPLKEIRDEGSKLRAVTEDELPLKLGEFVPGETVPTKPGTREAMETEVAKLQDMANASRSNIEYKIRETTVQGKPHLAIDKIERKVGNTPEKVYKTTSEGTFETTQEPIIRQKKFFSEISPENEKKAGEELIKLQTKAKHENSNKLYEIVKNEMDGTIVILEKSTKVKTTKIPGESELVLDRGIEPSIDDIYTPGKPELDLPSNPASTTPEKFKELGEFMAKYERGDKLTAEEALRFKEALGALSGYTKEGLQFSKSTAKQAYGSVSKQFPPKLKDANEKFAAYSDLLRDELKIDPSDVSFDQVTGDIILDRAFEQRIDSQIVRLARDTQAGRTARGTVERYFDGLAKLDPALAKKYKSQFSDIAESYHLAEKAKGFNYISPTHYYSKAPILIGNNVGKGVAALENNSPKVFKAASVVGSGVSWAVKALSSGHQRSTAHLAQSAQAKGYTKIAKMLTRISENSDQIKRNALVFMLLQNKGYREQLKELGDSLTPDMLN